MMNNKSYLHPSPHFCFGRDDLCKNIVKSAFETRSVLLFGGRQTGKTTLLLKIKNDVRQKLIEGRSFYADIPVYIDLMRLHHEATPADAFRLIIDLTRVSFCEHFADVNMAPLLCLEQTTYATIDTFASDIKTICASLKHLEVRILFLLDESKRILGTRFPRGFQDNLFSLLYGQDLGVREHIAIVFAGTQDLYKFTEDDTSPIGSRASTYLIKNLDEPDILSMMHYFEFDKNTTELESLGELLYTKTGGHAGLSAKMMWNLRTYEQITHQILENLSLKVSNESSTLFRLWLDSLSFEAQYIHDALGQHRSLSRPQIINLLHNKQLNRFLTDRVIDELLFTGIASFDRNTLLAKNNLYWDYIQEFIVANPELPSNNDLYQIIGSTERLMREIIGCKYKERWAEQAEEKIMGIFGKDRQEQIQKKKDNIPNQYRYSQRLTKPDVLETLTLGELQSLIIEKSAWQMFKHMFRDKREIEDMMKAIVTVRNDVAHFRMVPKKEIDRCNVACQDLSAIIEQELEKLNLHA